MPAMSTADALVQLRVLARSAEDPALPEADLSLCLRKSRVVDAAGRLLNDAAWVPTYDLNFAAMLAWQMKADLVANRFDFAVDGSSFTRSQVAAQCRAQASVYRGRIGGVLL